MPKYSAKSLEKLNQCVPELQDVMNEVIKYFDITIVTGHRGREEQEEKFDKGLTKVHFPYSKHNSFPSKAVDIAPYPINFKDINRFYLAAGFILGIAKSKGISLRWGGDWDRDTEVKDNSFDDLMHFEVVEDV